VGVSEDKTEAVKQYLKAADQGLAEAQYMAGICYRWGHGVPEDIIKAAKWFRDAAEQGYDKGQIALDKLYEQGQDLPQDLRQAANWSGQTAAQGQLQEKRMPYLSMAVEDIHGIESQENDRQRRYAVEIRNNYALAQKRWCSLSEAELLALSIQPFFSIKHGDELTRDGTNPTVDPSCLEMAAFFSVLPSNEAIQAMILLTCAVSFAELTHSLRVELLRLTASAYEMSSKEEFCSVFLQKNKGIESTDFWCEFRDKITSGCRWSTGYLGLGPASYGSLERCWSFRESSVWSIAQWTYPGPKARVSTGVKYRTGNGGLVDLHEIDVILMAPSGLLLVKCPQNTRCYLLKKVTPHTAVIVGEHESACDVISLLKREGRIPKTADTWEFSVDSMAMFGLWMVCLMKPRDNSWACAYCGEMNGGKTSKCFLEADYDDGERWGRAYLLECCQCRKTSIAVLGYLRRAEDGGNIICYEKSFTVGGGPDIAVLKEELLKSARNCFLISRSNLDKL